MALSKAEKEKRAQQNKYRNDYFDRQRDEGIRRIKVMIPEKDVERVYKYAEKLRNAHRKKLKKAS